MATKEKKDEDGGVVGRLAGRGEEALTRVMEGLGRNPRVTDAVDRAMSAKGRLDEASRSALNQVGLAAAEEIRELRSQLERLERRLAKLESGTKTSAKRTQTKKAPSAKRTTKSASSRTKKKTEGATSPATGRSIGGGVARGGAPSGGGTTT
jgi:DNA repair exonuclease SbcCD ATPase subunit